MRRHATAAIVALTLSLRHARPLRISLTEQARYLRKSVNCAMCFVGFGSAGSIDEARRAGIAAFLSTAFDVATDWRGFAPWARATFESLVTSHTADPEIARLAGRLYDVKHERHLANDGLARGPLALELILRTMGCLDDRRAAWHGLDAPGEMLQRIDDVLDWEDDRVSGDVNCLRSSRARRHLDALVDASASGQLDRWFPRGTMLSWVAAKAATRAGTLRRSWPDTGSDAHPR